MSFQALWLGLALGAFYALIRRRSPGGRLWQTVGVVLFGLFLFVPLLVFGTAKPIRKRRADVFDVRPFITRSFPDQVRKINSSGIRIPAISSTPPRPRNPFGPRIITSPESTITINPAKKTSEKTVHQRDGL